MRNIKYVPAIIVILLSAASCVAQNKTKPSIADFTQLCGSWVGNLTYLDYSSGKPYTMQANLIIKRINKTNNYSISNIYPNETNANSLDTLTVSSDGKVIDGKMLKSRRKLANGTVEFITEELGKDGNDNKKALIRLTYTFNQTSFSKQKDIQFVGEAQWIKRHEYLYTREPLK